MKLAEKAKVSVAVALLAASAAGSNVSSPVRVFTAPDKTPFWRTATSSSFTLQWEFPEGASSADLSVVGMNSSWSWSGLSVTSKALSLPEPSAPRLEDVYWLTLAFDNGVTNKAQVAVVCGVGTGEGAAVCKTTPERRYLRTTGPAVLQVPYGTAELSIDGEPVDTGLGGACGWYGWKPSAIGSYTLSLVSPSLVAECDVRVVDGGLVIQFN